MKISCVMHTYNSERFLDQALKSVQWADELVVIDMHSTDKTLEIAKKYNAKIVFHENLGYADPARQFGLNQCTGDWILALDSDELISPKLALKIREWSLQNEFQVFAIGRRNFFFGRELHGSGWSYKNDLEKRFFKKGFLSYGNLVHDFIRPHANAKIFIHSEIESSIIHFNYNSVHHFIQKLNGYTDLESAKPENKNSPLRKMAYQILREFFGRFFILKGYKDGWVGFYLSFAMAFYRCTSIAKANLPTDKEAIEIYKQMKNQ